jgi:hypothetical protein
VRLVAVVAGVLAVASGAARASQQQSFALVYEAPQGAGCPTVDALRAAVAGELGYDPWDPIDDGGSPRIVVTIRAVREGVRGRVEMRATDGRRMGARELVAARCGELSQTLALAIAVAIDPLRAVAPPPPAPKQEEPPPKPVVVVVAPPPPLVVAAPPPRPRLVDELRLQVAFGVQATIAAAPGPTIGFMGRVAFALRRWSLAVELRGDLPGSAAIDGGQVSASTMAAFLVPCLHHRIVGFCVFGGAGGQEVAGSGYLLARSSWVPYAAVGARIEAGLPLNGTLALLVRVDLQVPLTRTELYVGTERPVRVYQSAPLSNSFGLALSTR